MSLRTVLLLVLLLGIGCKDDSAGGPVRDGGAPIPRPADGGSTSGGGDPPSASGEVTPEQAAAGACTMGAMGDGGAQECQGTEQFVACVLDTCGMQECLDGPCGDLLECYQDADNPCEATCMRSMECTDCTDALNPCIRTTCFDMLMCGMVEEGGACDQLQDCCADLDPNDPMKFSCDAAAQFAPAGGDPACMEALVQFCP